MNTEDRAPGTSGTGGRRPGGDPLGMTEAEKRIAEWEARHDVAARGHRSPPDLLQHYLAHERLAHERLGSTRPAAGAGERDEPGAQSQPSAPQHQEPSTPVVPDQRQRTSRGLLRRLLRRG